MFDVLQRISEAFCALLMRMGGGFSHESAQKTELIGDNEAAFIPEETDAVLDETIEMVAEDEGLEIAEQADEAQHAAYRTDDILQAHSDVAGDKRSFVMSGKHRYQVLPTCPGLGPAAGEECQIKMASGKVGIYTVEKRLYALNVSSDDKYDWVFLFKRYKN